MKPGTLISIIILLPNLLYAQNAEEIVKKAEDIIKGDKSRAIIEMTIKKPDFTRTLKMESWWMGNEKALIKIIAPLKEAGNKTLKIGNEMWNYLKNTETTIKIPPSMMLQSWNGSDFTNDDLVRESNYAEDYNEEIAGTETIKGDECWKILMTPKTDAPVVWGKLHYWIRKDDYMPRKINYYDESGKLVRYMEFNDIKQMDDRKLPSEWAMHDNIDKGNYTKMKLSEMEFNADFSERIFSFRELERGN